MSTSTLDRLVDRPAAAAPDHSRVRRQRRRSPRVGVGQVVTAQVAVALLAVTLGRGPVATVTAGLGAAALLAVAWLRPGGRWLYEWVTVAGAYLLRRHGPASLSTPVPSGVARAVLDPAADDQPVGVRLDDHGLVAVLDLGDPGVLGEPSWLPEPADLVAASTAGVPLRVQLLVTGGPAPALAVTGAPAASYRQLTRDRLLSWHRVLVVVRVPAGLDQNEEQARQALASAVRRLRRRLAPLPVRPLDARSVPGLLAECALTDLVGAGAAQEGWHHLAREGWRHLGLPGGGVQAGYRIRRHQAGYGMRRHQAGYGIGRHQAGYGIGRDDDGRPRPGGPAGFGRLVCDLLGLPVTAAAVSVVGRAPAGPQPGDLVVRLSTPDLAALAVAQRALIRVAGANGAEARRLDGEQLPALAATLPLALDPPGPPPAAPPCQPPVAPPPRLPAPAPPAPAPGTPGGTARRRAPAGARLVVSGLMLGVNRRGAPVTVRLFRPAATRVLVVGGVAAAQLLALRAVALGARVTVHSSRPAAWTAFLRAVGSAADTVDLVPPDRPHRADPAGAGPPATGWRPLLVVWDTGPAPARPSSGQPWQCSLVVRDEVVPADVATLAGADLAVLQPLSPGEATLAAAALGLGDSAAWLARIRDDMVAVVAARTLRWAVLSPTPVETRLVGPLTRA